MEVNQSLVEPENRGLVVPHIEIGDITALISSQRYLKNLLVDLPDTYETKYSNIVLAAIEKEVKRKRMRRFLSIRSREYDSLDPEFFDRRVEDSDRLREELLPPEISYIISKEDGLFNLCRKLEDIIKEIGIFSRYFFVTPVNQVDWQRFIVGFLPFPEETSILGGAYHQTRVRQSELAIYEQGKGAIENIQMVPFALEEEHIDFYVGRILMAVINYNAEMKRSVDMLSGLKGEEVEPPAHLGMDTTIMNYCLDNLVIKPYTPATGIFAIQMNTAVSRIEERLKKITESLVKNAEALHSRLGEKPYSDAVRLVRKQDFDISHYRGYSSREGYVDYALKEVKDF